MLASKKGVMQHLNGSIRIPNEILTYLDSHIISKDKEDALEKAEKRWDEYHQCEAQIMAQVFTTIPESLLIEVWKLKTAKEVWGPICAKHETMALTVKVDMCHRMYKLKCQDDANVRTHLEMLM